MILFPLFAGRLFDFHVLDMFELGIEKYISLCDIKVMVTVIQLLSVLSSSNQILVKSEIQFEF